MTPLGDVEEILTIRPISDVSAIFLFVGLLGTGQNSRVTDKITFQFCGGKVGKRSKLFVNHLHKRCLKTPFSKFYVAFERAWFVTGGSHFHSLVNL